MAAVEIAKVASIWQLRRFLRREQLTLNSRFLSRRLISKSRLPVDFRNVSRAVFFRFILHLTEQKTLLFLEIYIEKFIATEY